MDTHAYGMSTTVALDVEAAEDLVRDALAAEGFGVLTEIDVAATLRTKLGIEREPYRILGACNPGLANQALGVDSEIGLLLPCNVAVYRLADRTVVSILDPAIMSRVTDQDGIEPIAAEAADRLRRVMKTIEAAG